MQVKCKASDSDKHELDVNHLLYHQGKLYSAADDGKIKIWSLDLKSLGEIQAHPCSVYCLAASNDTLYSCSNDGTVKCWPLADPKAAETVVIKDETKEFWRVRFSGGFLFFGDDQGCLQVFKDGKLYGDVDIAVPIKDMVIHDTLLVTSKDNDVVVTELLLQGLKPQYGVKCVMDGRGPLDIAGDKLVLITRDGKGLVVHQITAAHEPIKKFAAVENAHDMIINGMSAVNWDGNQLVFSGGWDKNVKKWKIDDSSLKLEETCSTDFVVTAISPGEKGQVFVGGADGHIARIDL